MRPHGNTALCAAMALAFLGILACGVDQIHEGREREGTTSAPQGTTLKLGTRLSITLPSRTTDGSRIAAPTPAPGVDLRLAGLVLGIASLALAIIGAALHGNARLMTAAVALAVIPIAWEFFVIGVACAIVFLVVMVYFGIDPILWERRY